MNTRSLSTWKEDWNDAFEKRDPEIVRSVLRDILASIETSTEPSQKAAFLLAACTCYAILGDGDHERACLEEARHIAPKNDMFFQMNAEFHKGAWLGRQGNFQESLNTFDNLLRQYGQELKSPNLRYLYDQVQFSRAIALAMLGMFTEARPLLEEARSFDLAPDDRRVLFEHLGVCYAVLEEDKSAVRAFLESKKLGVSTDFQAAWHFYIGRAYYRLENYAEAKQEFLECEKLLKAGLAGPKTSELYKLLSYTCIGLQQTVEAEMYSRLAKAI